MAIDIPRLVAACDDELIRQLLGRLTPEQDPDIDWKLKGRALGLSVQDAVSQNSAAWVRLQKIASLAKHGMSTTIRSVLYNDRILRDEFDELDGGMETAAVWLALKDDALFEYCLSALHADTGLNKRSWRAFRVRLDKGARPSFSDGNIERFQALVREAIRTSSSFDAPGKLATHHFHRDLFPEETRSRKALEQVTVFAEARMFTEEYFDEERVETRRQKKVDNISVVFDQARGELDVVTLGGQRFIEEIVIAFFRVFFSSTPRLELLIRRKVKFEQLLLPFRPIIPEGSRFTHAKVDEIRVRSPSGALYTFDAKHERYSMIDVYDAAELDLGGQSPFNKSDWAVVSARLVLHLPPSKPGLRPKIRTVDLKSNGHTNLREQDDNDLYIADELLTRWGLLEPYQDDGDEE